VDAFQGREKEVILMSTVPQHTHTHTHTHTYTYTHTHTHTHTHTVDKDEHSTEQQHGSPAYTHKFIHTHSLSLSLSLSLSQVIIMSTVRSNNMAALGFLTGCHTKPNPKLDPNLNHNPGLSHS
jgi:hypothetical protein